MMGTWGGVLVAALIARGVDAAAGATSVLSTIEQDLIVAQNLVNEDEDDKAETYEDLENDRFTAGGRCTSFAGGPTRIALGAAITSKGTLMKSVSESPFFEVCRCARASWRGPLLQLLCS